MTSRSQRALFAVAVLVTVLCTDQLLAADGITRPQVVAEVADRVAGRLMSAFRKQQPSRVARCETPRRFVTAIAAPICPADLARPHPADLPVQDLRLPPPASL